jgi:hypothetical protein
MDKEVVDWGRRLTFVPVGTGIGRALVHLIGRERNPLVYVVRRAENYELYAGCSGVICGLERSRPGPLV